MKIQLKKSLIEQIKIPSQFRVEKLTSEGKEFEENLKYYLSKYQRELNAGNCIKLRTKSE